MQSQEICIGEGQTRSHDQPIRRKKQREKAGEQKREVDGARCPSHLYTHLLPGQSSPIGSTGEGKESGRTREGSEVTAQGGLDDEGLTKTYTHLFVYTHTHTFVQCASS